MATRGVNKVILVGNVGQDPDVKHFDNGGSLANLNLATSETWKDRQSGEQQERTDWHRVVFRGNIVQVVEKYVKKGSKLYIEGKLQTRKWQDQNGQDQYTTEVIVDITGQMQMLDSMGGGQGQQQQSSAPKAAQNTQQGNQKSGKIQQAKNNAPQQSSQADADDFVDDQQTQGQSMPEPVDDFDDDIPF